MKKLVAIMIGAFMLGACNTMEGVGQDIQSGGKAIEREARQAK